MVGTNTATGVPLAVVLVHRNRSEDCVGTIEAFADQGRPVRVIVVDNGSVPLHLDRIRAFVAAGPELGSGSTVELVELDRNTGFGPGANAGLRRWLADAGGSDWALLAPHDARPDPGCVERLLEACEREPLAGLACADVGDGMAPCLDPYFGGMVRARRRTDGWEACDYPHGTLMALNRRCCAEVGLFDERYFAYCEEAELGLRARRRGWRCGIVHGARVRNTHLSSSVALVDYLQQRNTLLLVREMSGRYHATIRFIISVWQLSRGLLQPGSRPLVFDARARVAGLRDYLRGRYGPPPEWLFPPDPAQSEPSPAA